MTATQVLRVVVAAPLLAAGGVITCVGVCLVVVGVTLTIIFSVAEE